MARAVRRSAEATAAEARSEWLPDLSLTASLVQFELPMPVAPFHSLDPSTSPTFDETLVHSTLGLRYTLLDGGARAGRSGQADARVQVSDARLRDRESHLLEQVVRAYLDVLTVDEVVEAQIARQQALVAELRRAEGFFEQGAAPHVEVLRVRAAVNRAEADLRSSEIQRGLARRELGRLIGLPEDRVATLTLDSVPEPPALDSDQGSESLPPSVEEALRDVEVAEQGRRIARAAWLPRLSVGAGLRQFGAWEEDFSYEWQASLELAYPLFSGGARGAAGERAQAGLDGATERLHLSRLESRAEIDRARTSLLEAQARARALGAAVEQYQEVARIEALALSEGSGVQRDLMAAEASLLEARAQLARARNGAVAAGVALARASGALTLTWLETHLERQR
jgi:outer membrane protein